MPQSLLNSAVNPQKHNLYMREQTGSDTQTHVCKLTTYFELKFTVFSYFIYSVSNTEKSLKH